MKVFVTGATGFVGSAVVDELLGAGHRVLGLARSPAGAAALKAKGAAVHEGSLEDVDSLTRGAAEADAVTHLAFNHDFSRWQENCALDERAIAALGEGLKGSDRPLIVTSGVALMTPGRVATEQDQVPTDFPRGSERAADALVAQGVRASAVRLPPTTHGRGEDHGFVPILIRTAREKGVSGYVGDGSNHWPAAHRLDAAKLFRLALERGAAAGARYHAVAEQGVPMKAIADVIGRRLGLPVRSIPKEDAEAHFGWFAMFAAIDVQASSTWTREALGWTPQQPDLLQDLDDPAYFGG